ncbi:MAG: large repetitive protein [Verrucomicrobiota bacterium]
MKIMKLSFVITALLGAVASVHASTCSVPSAGYPTIQAAVDDTTCSTINVAPGVYAENVSVSRAVTLNGAQAGQPVASRTSGGPSESTVIGANPAGPSPVFLVNASSVTIDGFTIKNTVVTGTALGVEVDSGSVDAVMINDFFDGIESAAGAARAIYVQNGVSNVNINNNDIRNLSASADASALLVGDNNSTTGTEYCFMHHNTVSGITSLAGGAAAAVYRKVAVIPSAIEFQNNTVTNLAGAASARGVSLECDALTFLIAFNDFSGFSSAAADVTGVWINNNPHGYEGEAGGNNFDLPATAFGVKVQNADAAVYPPPLCAGCNWWGSADGPGPVGPGHGCRVSSGVFYFNWRVTPDHLAPCNGSSAPITETDCKSGGWITHVRPDGSVFKSQGDCIQFVNNGH